jgi:hypothetical protein
VTSRAVCRLPALAGLTVLCLGLPACNKVDSRVNKANFDKLKPGMSVPEVEAVLGPGQDDAEGLDTSEGSSVGGAAGITTGDIGSMSRPRSTTKWLKWGNDKKSIRVGFDNGKAAQGKISQQGL